MSAFETWGRLRHAPGVLERLADALDTGFPVLGAIELVADRETHRATKRGLIQAAKALRTGSSIGNSLKWILTADGQWRAMPDEVANVATFCRDLAAMLRRRNAYFSVIWASVRYPLGTLALAVLMGVGFWIWGLPQMVAIQSDFGGSASGGLVQVMAIREWLFLYWKVGFFGVVGVLGMAAWVLQPRVNGWITRMLLPLGTADYFQFWALLIRAGVPANRAIKMAGGLDAAETGSVVPAIVRFFGLSPAAEAFLSHGEATGTLDKIFQHLASDQTQSQQEKWRRIGAVLHPILLAGTGGILIALFSATYLPIINVIK